MTGLTDCSSNTHLHVLRIFVKNQEWITPISAYDDYILQYNDRTTKFKYHQLTTKWIGKVFGLSPGSILLFTEQEEQLETPDDGNFHLEERKVYKVQGEPIPPLGVGDTGPSMLNSSSSQPSAVPAVPTPTGM